MKKNTQTKHFFFCAFSDLASVIRHVTCTEEGETRLYLADRIIHLQFRQEAILVNGKSMQGDSLILTDPGHNEKVLFYRLQDGTFILDIPEMAEIEQKIDVTEMFR